VLRTVWNAIRTGFGLAAVVLYVLVVGPYVILLTRINPRSRQITPLMRGFGRLITFMGGVRMRIDGAERLDPEGSYLIVSNHQSNLDPPIHMAYLPVSVRFLAKKELFRIPVFGAAMRSIGIVETDRAARVGAHRAINKQVARVIELKRSLIIYPEGTRSRDGEIHHFKKGAFRIAVDTGLPVVPTTIAGAWEAWPPERKTVRGGEVRMVIDQPIPTSDLGRDDIDDLREHVHRIIDDTYRRIRPG
jgi:1-acyl-sn-glycerol-3-phosphate acyltransferase